MNKKNVVTSYVIYGILTILLPIFSLFYAFGLLTARGVDFEVDAATADKNILIYSLAWIGMGVVYAAGLVYLILQQKRGKSALVGTIAAASLFLIVTISSFLFTGFF